MLAFVYTCVVHVWTSMCILGKTTAGMECGHHHICTAACSSIYVLIHLTCVIMWCVYACVLPILDFGEPPGLSNYYYP